MNLSDFVLYLDPGHVKDTPGKHSPDKSIYEWSYVREILARVEKKLDLLGIAHWNTHPEDDFVILRKGSCKDLDSRDLVLRRDRMNERYNADKRAGKKCALVSIHLNGLGNGGQWMSADYWSIWTTRGQNNSDKFATVIWNEANALFPSRGMKVGKQEYADGDPDYESDFYIIKQAPCVAVLVENFFQDNKKNVEYLLSEQGKEDIADVLVRGVVKWIESL